MEVVETENLEAEVIVSGIPSPELKWMLGSEHLSSKKTTERIVEIETKTIETPDGRQVMKSTLKLTNVKLEDCCELIVIAENKHGLVKSSSSLTIMPLASLKIPKIVGNLKNVTVKKGESAQFKVDVKGNPEPKLKWFIDGIEIQSKSNTYGECVIDKCQSSGTVKLVATNENGEDSAQVSQISKRIS